MFKLFTACLAVFLCSTQAMAEWATADMNKRIDQTNFIVDGRCSGTLVSLKHRYILTNYHCIQHKIKELEIEVVDKDGFTKKRKIKKRFPVPISKNAYNDFSRVGSTSYTTEIKAYDIKRDIAILQILAKSIPFTEQSPILPKGGVSRGEKTITVGNPAMLDASIVRGEISSTTRAFRTRKTNGDLMPFYQFSGGIFGGNSGGSLYNEDGFLIGIPSMKHPQANFIGLAIPVEYIRKFLKKNCMESVYNSMIKDSDCLARKKAKKGRKAKTDSMMGEM